jgi:hypothetical protein
MTTNILDFITHLEAEADNLIKLNTTKLINHTGRGKKLLETDLERNISQRDLLRVLSNSLRNFEVSDEMWGYSGNSQVVEMSDTDCSCKAVITFNKNRVIKPECKFIKCSECCDLKTGVNTLESDIEDLNSELESYKEICQPIAQAIWLNEPDYMYFPEKRRFVEMFK